MGILKNPMKKCLIPLALSLSLFSATLATAEEKSFRFPGADAEAGQQAFVTLNCVQCHSVSGVKMEEPKGERRLDLQLAAEERFVRSYEDLLKAITNPKHVVTEQYREILSKSEIAGEIEALMPDMTSDMSAKQLIDLAAFLDQVYAKSGNEYRK
jgi:mono/diheme cytochrome c family protein